MSIVVDGIVVGDIYYTKQKVPLKVIAVGYDSRVVDRRVVVFINKDTYRGIATGNVLTATVDTFKKLVSA